jgi:malonate-semialdehyde dehydrogenase (acetylating)/methylmalonate-semialdehyde dehydrogenase
MYRNNMMLRVGARLHTLKNYVGGKFVESKGSGDMQVTCPLTQEPLARVPQSTQAEFDAAVANSK